MTISRIYREFLIEDIIKESLKKGTVLSKGEIESELEIISEDNPTLSEPFTQRSLYNTEEETSLSSSKINNITLALHNDLSVAYKALIEQAKSITSTYDSVTSEFKAVEKRVKTLEERSRNLLLISKNAEGYLDYVSDTFINKDKIDSENSDIFVDNKVGIITLDPLSHTRVSMPVISEDLQFNVTSRDQLKGITLAPGSELEYAFTDQENIWIQRVEMGRGVGSVTADLIVRMPNADAEISKIIYKPAISDEGNITTVTIQYSDDGLNWYNPEGDITARLEGDTTLIFTPIKAAYWKFVLNKAGYDEFRGDSYVYEFGAKTIQMYGVEYSIKDNKLEGTLHSIVLTGDDGKLFNRVSLKTCESIPEETNINYFIAGLTETEISDYQAGTISLDDLNFNAIDPLDRENPVNQILLNFANIDSTVNISVDTIKNPAIDFRYSNDYNILVDHIFPSNIVKEETMILRNTGNNTEHDGGNDPVKVKNIDHGWSFDGTYYFCHFYIAEDSGKTVDLGQESAEIDGISVNGKIFLRRGFHRLKTHKRNWRGIDPSAITTIDNPDVLYPYNHKYIVEGIGNMLYGVDMTSLVAGEEKKDIVDPDGLYSGISRYWEKTLEEVTIFNFTQNIENDNYDVYAFTKSFAGDDRIAVKDSLEPGLLINEKLAIITRAVSGDLHKGIILKTVLSSEDSKITPVLSEYIVRLGF